MPPAPDDEHTSIIDAIADGQPQAAEDAIRHHILHVQNSLDLEQTQKTEPDLAKILSGANVIRIWGCAAGFFGVARGHTICGIQSSRNLQGASLHKLIV